MPDLEITDLHVEVESKPILNGIDLVVKSGEVHAIMGPNGSGKSTLALTIMGHPRYKVRRGDRDAIVAESGKKSTTDMPIPQFRKMLAEKMKLLEIDDSFITRSVNDGFSGGEKKRLEMLQMHMFAPTFAVLDETDSGLDIDALRVVSRGIEALRAPEVGILLITHYERMLRYVTPDFVHVLVDGRVVRTGGRELAAELEAKGYDFVREELYAGKA